MSLSQRPLQSSFGRMYRQSNLSKHQLQLWIGQKMQPQSPHYNMAFVFVIDSKINEDNFAEAWQKLVNTHEILRSRIIEREGIPHLEFHKPGSCSLKIIDYSNRDNPLEDYHRWTKARCSRVLALEEELIDSVLVKLGKNQYGWYLNQHHIITDASATVLLHQKQWEAYAAFQNDNKNIEIDVANDYFETIRNLGIQLTNELSASANYWKGKNRGPDIRNTFFGRKNNADTTASERLTLNLNKEQSHGLRALAAEDPYRSLFKDISIFAVFSTLLTSWIHHVSGQREICFDSPVQNRPTPESKQSLGMFIEMFPLSVAIDRDETFKTLGKKCLSEVQQLLKNAVPGVSFASENSPSSVVLNYFPTSFASVQDTRVQSEWIHSGHSDNVHLFRLQVHDYDNTGCYTLHLDFNQDAFSKSERHQGLHIFQSIIENFLKNLDQPIGEVGVLTVAEQKALLTDFNATHNFNVPEKTVIALFNDQVNRTPDEIALCYATETLTFRELHTRVQLVAGRLRTERIHEKRPVAILMKRSSDSVIAILAVLTAGSFYIPIDPEYPAKRIEYILKDSESSVVITHRGLDKRITRFDQQILDFQQLMEGEEVETFALPKLRDLAYTIYTSGSTGEPKGVMIEHIGLADYLEWAARQYVRGDKVTIPLFTSLSFDLTVTSLFLPLITGGTLVVYEEAEGPVDSVILDVVNENKIDLIKLTPSHLSLLQQMDLSRSRIKRMVLGGEDLKVQLAQAITDQFEHEVEIYNEYGPTEGVVGCMIHQFTPIADTSHSVPIGVPADHVQLYVVNDFLNPVPRGVPGELCISRIGLARGYHGQKELTGKKFVSNPFSKEDRLYRTGDLVRFNERGFLEFLGRIDRQVKLSGLRIEPGEIENQLLSHPTISSCTVTTYTHPHQAKHTEKLFYCKKCGLPSNYPKVVFDEEGVCDICHAYDDIKDSAKAYFKTMPELQEVLNRSREKSGGNYDCLALLSGGKDSTYALCSLVDMGLNVLAFTLENGYLASEAKANIQRVVTSLGVDHEFAETPYINEIFKDSLTRFSNVCNGCFKTIYTLSINRAKELKIPIIVTGLSRGQFFETRLTENLFKSERFTPADVDRAVLEARKTYHQVKDSVTIHLDNSNFEDDNIFEEVQFVDFYRYCDVSMAEMMDYLKKRVSWVRPADTGRSTNCLINDLGIYIHNKERGFHNYALPYSWDVRMGHKTREEAIHELNDEWDLENIHTMLQAVEYDEDRLSDQTNRTRLLCYYVSAEPIVETDIRRFLSKQIPSEWIPSQFIPLDTIPLTPHGKVDTEALPHPNNIDDLSNQDYVEPVGPVQEQIAEIWKSVLGVDRASAELSFFQFGGTSLAAMEVMLKVCNSFELDLPLQTVFQYKTISTLAEVVENKLIEEVSELEEEEAKRLVGGKS